VQCDGLVLLQVQQQQGRSGIPQQRVSLPQWQALAQQAGDRVCTIGQADRRGHVWNYGFRWALHATQCAADRAVIEHTLLAIAVAQLATGIFDPALQAGPLLAHAQGRVAQCGRIADDQQITVVQILAAADLAVRQGRSDAQAPEQGLLSLDIGSHYQHACHPCSPCDRLPGDLASPRLGHRPRRPS
jgi:hypothetical protein